MVSTRQMCGNAGGAGGYDEAPITTRATVVRRTTHYQHHHHQPQQQQQQQVQQHQRQQPLATIAPVLNFLDLPTELIIKTLGYLDYKKISNLRLVSDNRLRRRGVGVW